MKRKGAVFVKSETFVANATYAPRLNEIINDLVDGRITPQEYDAAMLAETAVEHFWYTNESYQVFYTCRILGLLIEFQIKGDDTLWYCYNDRLEARPI